ncbi:STAS domain-containing protein [Halobacillus sp. ACCC02827]|uniref:STAS domain-containing protein n=1 Tax=Bacillaceae TaxID=186817 RepID=UPI0002A4DDA9|nr:MULTISPECIES: STAS domain-containing protein [Bacillaceae]ELK46370.1 positive regulator of sigma-B activity [Halobacillus sp. BAB-2008]QHT48327.1 STAS domain-containing protein [Bacillus sp. SB49]WJE15564.1 STAS domain-containing protein [Halobacillus sp. ACCC02827]
MNTEYMYIGEKLINDHVMLSDKVEEIGRSEFPRGYNKTAAWEKLFVYLGEALLNGSGQVDDKVFRWAEEAAERKVEAGISLDQSLQTIGFVRRALWEVFETQIEGNRFSPSSILQVCKVVNPLIDKVALYFSQVYLENIRIETEKKETRLEELSVPVVPITEGVAVLPLIGEVDTIRAQWMMEHTLDKSTVLDLDFLFIDVSGVPVIDTVVAHYIYQVVHALELVGVHATLTGLRPETAKALVDMGIDFAHVHTKAGLHQALEEIGMYRHV